jgi:hypothetical protein
MGLNPMDALFSLKVLDLKTLKLLGSSNLLPCGVEVLPFQLNSVSSFPNRLKLIIMGLNPIQV